MLELVVVLAIMLILTLLAVGSYSNLRRSRSVRSAAESIQALFMGARAYAITTNGTYRVVIQLRDPVVGTPQTVYWIDEIFANGTGEISPADLTNINNAAKTPKITTPEKLPEDVDLFDVRVAQAVAPQNTETVTAATETYVVVRFFPDGSSDDATVRLVRAGSPTATGNIRSYSVRLEAPTAKPKIVSGELQ